MKKNLLLSFLLVSTATLFVLEGCKNDKGDVPPPVVTHCDSLNVSYNMDVIPIVANNCATSSGCHDTGSFQGDFTLYDNLSGVAHTVKERIQLPTTDFQHMPQGGVLTAAQIDTLVCWIDGGALNN